MPRLVPADCNCVGALARVKASPRGSALRGLDPRQPLQTFGGCRRAVMAVRDEPIYAGGQPFGSRP